ncbi:RecQ family ATP-dependent DNA helicase [Candidatus Gracilibacteria bacterium]|nr:RecQ family ATP-dependent DNA helicase [Candidatus Gracilibacteria bacterium]
MEVKLQQILQQQFKLNDFREGQKEIIESVVNGNNTLVFMPTGGGKSLTYQLPGIYREGICLVISPLISLMKDQVDKLNELGIKTELINSTIDKYDISIILNDLSNTNTDIKFLYIAPERLNSSDFLRVISKVKISLVAIDEAHCISAWGHDFRPSYMKIRGFLDNLKQNGNFPIMALTATATEKVRKDIVERLGVKNHNSFTAGFDRKNITIIVREISKKDEKMQKVAEILDKTKGSGIIYCSSRKAVKEVYDSLIENGVNAGIYTGAMTPENREVEQNRFMNDTYKVIVATNAFGMGIDKKDIRFVIHYNLPGSIENYYQEVGRAGRDGKKSFGVVIASFGDTKIQEFFIENTYPSKKEILKVYDYIYSGEKEGKGSGKVILKTQRTIASEAGVDSDMKVGSALKILEKYNIIRKGVSENQIEEGFRGRGLTTIQEKRKHSHLLIDWKHQEALKEEAYYKLEQIKKLLFYPTCRKRFILNYFGDKEDLDKLPENCGTCDFCLEKEKYANIEVEDYVNTSVFALVLDVVKDNDTRIGVGMMTKFLWGSRDAKLIDWGLDKKENFGALGNLSADLIGAVIESLISQNYLEKTDGKYPLLGITEAGRIAINRNDFLRDDNKELQHYIRMKLGANSGKKKTKNNDKQKSRTPRGETYNETLRLYNNGKTIDEIVEIRGLKKQTIENHLVSLYISGKIDLVSIMKLTKFSNLKIIKEVINKYFSSGYDGLKVIKEKTLELGNNVSYLEINIAIAMIEKGDL